MGSIKVVCLTATGFLVGLLLIAGCGTGAVAPSASARPVVTTRPVTAVATTEPPSPSPGSTLTAAPLPTGRAVEVIAAFIDHFARKQPPFHLEMDAEFTVTGGSDRATGATSANGDIIRNDFDGEIEFPGMGTAQIRFVDGVAYARRNGAAWMSFPDFKQSQPLNPFSLLDPADIQYVGETRRDDRDVHQLTTTEWVGGDIEAEGFSNLRLLSSRFDVYVTTQGIPVEAVLDFSVSGLFAGRALPVQIEYHVVYRFSRVGKPVEIRAPL